MAQRLGFHLERRDVLAAAANAVLEAIDEEKVAVVVATKRVAGVEPAVAPRRGRRLRVAVIAGRQFPGPRGAQDQFTHLPVGHFDVVCVHHPRLDAGARPAAGAERGRIGRGTDRHGRFGHVERRAHQQAVALGHGAGILVPRHGDHVAQRVIAILRPRRLPQQELRHAADQARARDAEAPDRRPEIRGAEAVDQHAGAALGQPIQHGARPAHVEQGQVGEQPVVLGEVIHAHRRATPGLHVGADDGLGGAGGAGREHQVDRVPRLDRSFGLGTWALLQHRRRMPAQRSRRRRRRRDVAGHDHVVQPRGGDLGQPRHERGVGEHHCCVRDVDRVLEQTAAIAGVERHVHRTQVVGGQPAEHRLAPVGHPAEHVRALLDAEAAQCAGGPLDAVERLRERPRGAVLELEERVRGALARPASQQLADDALGAPGNPARVVHAGAVYTHCQVSSPLMTMGGGRP